MLIGQADEKSEFVSLQNGHNTCIGEMMLHKFVT